MYSAYKLTMAEIPKTYRKLVVTKHSPKFRDVTEIQTADIVKPGPGEILVRNRFVGINATDVNIAAGRFYANIDPPFVCGFEGLGTVVSVGEGCKAEFKVGQTVGYTQIGAFAEYIVLKQGAAFRMPSAKAEYLPLMVSGLTAAIALDKTGNMKSGETVLVTAAAGGTGQFAVQWAKQAGCHVIGVCSTQEKVDFLKSIGCDRTINYNTEDLGAVLKAEYPKGVDIVYECVGGSTFETCLNALAVNGRLVVIGFISGYEQPSGTPELSIQPQALLRKLLFGSQSIRGFLLGKYAELWGEYMIKLVGMYELGKIRSEVDLGDHREGSNEAFRGVESITDAVEYMYAKKNIGKILVEFN